jgi:hypothetical protein
MSPTPDYFDRYENFALTRSESGVLTLRFPHVRRPGDIYGYHALRLPTIARGHRV